MGMSNNNTNSHIMSDMVRQEVKVYQILINMTNILIRFHVWIFDMFSFIRFELVQSAIWSLVA